ncbi:MAG: hypothetical protein MUO21_04915, partial [Nitrososphaeraceae archaeon]|nr:hypothetical protein [Nitrososphaeraceae archaeon]
NLCLHDTTHSPHIEDINLFNNLVIAITLNLYMALEYVIPSILNKMAFHTTNVVILGLKKWGDENWIYGRYSYAQIYDLIYCAHLNLFPLDIIADMCNRSNIYIRREQTRFYHFDH